MCVDMHIVRFYFSLVQGAFRGFSDCYGFGTKGGKEVEEVEGWGIFRGGLGFFGIHVGLNMRKVLENVRVRLYVLTKHEHRGA